MGMSFTKNGVNVEVIKEHAVVIMQENTVEIIIMNMKAVMDAIMAIMERVTITTMDMEDMVMVVVMVVIRTAVLLFCVHLFKDSV